MAAHFATLDSLWQTIISLNASSTADEFQKFASFFAADGSAYLAGMANPKAVGHAQLAEASKNIHEAWSALERRVTAKGVSEDGNTVFVELDLKLDIQGQVLEHFAETEVVVFGADGLIKEYRLHADPLPVMNLVKNA